MKAWVPFILIVCASCGASASDARYLALGDSFTIGTGSSPNEAFPARLAALAQKRGVRVNLLNLGINGYSTQELIDEELPQTEGFAPTHVTLAIGANDLVRGRGPEDYRKNLKLIFAALAKAGIDRKHVWAIPQPDWSKSPAAQAFGDPNALHAQIVAYNTILREEAMAFGGGYVDLFPLMEQQALQHLIANDGLHPSAAAHAAWAVKLDPRIALK